MPSLRSIFLLVTVLSVALALRVVGLDPAFQRSRALAANEADFIRSPGAPLLQLVAFEHRLGWADLVWLSMVQETGKESPSWNRVVRWTEVGTDLDPLHYTIYHSAAIQLTLYGRRIAEADALLQKGWAVLPARWELPMLLGYIAYFIRGDAFAGSEFMHAAAEVQDSPPFLAALSGRMRYHAGDAEGAIAMLEDMLPALEGPARRDAEERISMLRSEPILSEYDRACEVERSATGQIPAPSALYSSGRVSSPPVDLLGGDIELDSNCIARTEMIRVREFEAVRNTMGSQRRRFDPKLPPALQTELDDDER